MWAIGLTVSLYLLGGSPGGFTIPLHAAPAPDPTPAAITNQQGFTLTVVDASNDQPIVGAEVLAPGFVMPARPSGTENHPPRTDARGVVEVRIPAAFPSFSVSVRHPDYAPREMTWNPWGNAPADGVRPALPAKYTMKLARGITIGGVVRDENGRPIAGAAVGAWGNELQARPSSGAAGSWVEYSAVQRQSSPSIKADGNGFWTQSQFPGDLGAVWVEIERPDGARAQFITAGMARPYFQPQPAEIQLAELRATNAVCVLKEGVTVRGIVTDEAGQPVGGARVRERGLGSMMAPGFHSLTNSADGRFGLAHRVESQLLLCAEAQGYALKSVALTLSPEMPETRIVLQKAQPARIRVVDDKEAPLAGVHLEVPEWRNRNQLLDWTGRTDAEGRAIWTNAPLEAVVVMAEAENYPARSVKLVPGSGETVVRLRQGAAQAVKVLLKAVDDKAGQPIPGFEVFRTQQFPQGFTNWGKAGEDGLFRNEIRAKDFSQGATYGLMIRAEGYSVWTGDMLYYDEGDQELTVKLKQSRAPAGVVLRPDGQPAADAKVILNSSDQSVYSYRPSEFNPMGQGFETQRTGADGSFRFRTAADQHRLLVTHPTGFATLTIEEFLAAGNVRLQAWGVVEGVLHYGGKPVPQSNVSIKWPLSWANVESHHLIYNKTTDAAGRFVFTNLPPGEYVLYRMPRIFNGRPTTESHRMTVTVAAGQTAKVDYTLGGRTILGHVEADGAVDWNNDPQVLVAKQAPLPPEPVYYGYGDMADYRKARRAYANSPQTLEFERKRQQFLLSFDADGNFRADDVPPGAYELRLRVTKPPAKGSSPRYYGNDNEPELGALVRPVTVPAGTPGTEVDLGAFELALKFTETVRSGPLSLRGSTLEGRPFDLADVRGQPAVLVFWANWAPASATKLAELRTASEHLAPNQRAAFVSVNFDEDPELARRGVQGLTKGWTHVRLDGAGRFEVTERLGVDTLPCSLLLNREGAVAAHELKGERLPALLERLGRQTAKQ